MTNFFKPKTSTLPRFQFQLESKRFKDFLGALKPLSMANLEFTKHGMNLQAMDATNSSLTTMQLSKEFFDLYQYKEKLPDLISMCINVVLLKQISQHVKENEKILFKHNIHSQMLEIEIFPDEDSDFLRQLSFKMKVDTPEEEKLDVPDSVSEKNSKNWKTFFYLDFFWIFVWINPVFEVTIASDEFEKLISVISDINDTVLVVAKSNSLSFILDSEIGKGKVIYYHSNKQDQVKAGNCVKIVSNGNTEYKENFNLKIMALFKCKFSDFIKIRIKQGSPLHFEFKAHNFGYINYYLAPTLESEWFCKLFFL